LSDLKNKSPAKRGRRKIDAQHLLSLGFSAFDPKRTS